MHFVTILYHQRMFKIRQEQRIQQRSQQLTKHRKDSFNNVQHKDNKDHKESDIQALLIL